MARRHAREASVKLQVVCGFKKLAGECSVPIMLCISELRLEVVPYARLYPILYVDKSHGEQLSFLGRACHVHAASFVHP